MSFSQPDLSQVLSKEQLLNTNLTSLRTELRNKLTLLGISYSDSDTILQLIEKAAPNHYLDINTDELYYYDIGNPIRIKNISTIGWDNNHDDEGYYLNVAHSNSSSECVGMGTYSTYQKDDVYGTDNFKMRMKLSYKEGYNNSYAGVGFVIGTPSAETAFNGVFFGVAQNSNGELYPARITFNNSTSPTITYITNGGTIPSTNKFLVIVENDYDASYGSIDVVWRRLDGSFIWNDYVQYSEFNSSGMSGKISMAAIVGTPSPVAGSKLPKLVNMFNSYIDK